MLFMVSLADNIVTGRKTQTRRPQTSLDTQDQTGSVYRKGRSKFVIGQSYAVQPGRGKPTIELDGKPLRIVLTAIKPEDARNISYDDAWAEGFDTRRSFLETWISLYDQAAYKREQATYPNGYIPSEHLRAWLSTRPDHRYKAWALTFHVADPLPIKA